MPASLFNKKARQAKGQPDPATTVSVKIRPVLWIDDVHCLPLEQAQQLFATFISEFGFPVIFTVSESTGYTRILDGLFLNHNHHLSMFIIFFLIFRSFSCCQGLEFLLGLMSAIFRLCRAKKWLRR
jgi:hypothetical protein